MCKEDEAEYDREMLYGDYAGQKITLDSIPTTEEAMERWPGSSEGEENDVDDEACEIDLWQEALNKEVILKGMTAKRELEIEL